MQDESLYQDLVDEDQVQEADIAKEREEGRERKRGKTEGINCNGRDESLVLNGKQGQAAVETNGGTHVGLAK